MLYRLSKLNNDDTKVYMKLVYGCNVQRISKTNGIGFVFIICERLYARRIHPLEVRQYIQRQLSGVTICYVHILFWVVL